MFDGERAKSDTTELLVAVYHSFGGFWIITTFGEHGSSCFALSIFEISRSQVPNREEICDAE
jgi:hypothetical protein